MLRHIRIGLALGYNAFEVVLAGEPEQPLAICALFDGKERVGWDYKEYKENGETVIDVLQPETYSLKVYFSADGHLTDLVLAVAFAAYARRWAMK